jgi:Holliday junction resolvase
MNSRQKGARGEREAASAWAETFGGQARRGQQFSGSKDSPDIVISQPNIHVEVKRTERGNPYCWLEQAARDAGGKVPVVMHKRNGKPWLLIMELTHAPRFILAAQDTGPTAEVGAEEVPGADARESVSQGDT